MDRTHHDSSVYLQSEEEVAGLREYMEDEAFKELNEGWDVDFLMDPWDYGHFLGWDARAQCAGGRV